MMDLKVMKVFTFYTLVQSFIYLAGGRTRMLLCRGVGMKIVFKTPFFFFFFVPPLDSEDQCRLQGLAAGTAIWSYHKVVVVLRACVSKAAETLPVSMEQEIQKKKKITVLLVSFPYIGCFPHTPFCHDAIL